MANINIEILPNGKVNLSVDGVKGSGCEDLTKFIEEALGEVQSRERTAEYYEQEVEETVRVGSSED